MEIDGSKFGPPPSQSSQLLSRLTTKTSAKFFFLILLVLILYREVFRNLVFDWWNDENFSHGFLIPLLSGYFVWERRKRLVELPIQWHWSGFVVLITGLPPADSRSGGRRIFSDSNFIALLDRWNDSDLPRVGTSQRAAVPNRRADSNDSYSSHHF